MTSTIIIGACFGSLLLFINVDGWGIQQQVQTYQPSVRKHQRTVQKYQQPVRKYQRTNTFQPKTWANYNQWRPSAQTNKWPQQQNSQVSRYAAPGTARQPAIDWGTGAKRPAQPAQPAQQAQKWPYASPVGAVRDYPTQTAVPPPRQPRYPPPAANYQNPPPAPAPVLTGVATTALEQMHRFAAQKRRLCANHLMMPELCRWQGDGVEKFRLWDVMELTKILPKVPSCYGSGKRADCSQHYNALHIWRLDFCRCKNQPGSECILNDCGGACSFEFWRGANRVYCE